MADDGPRRAVTLDAVQARGDEIRAIGPRCGVHNIRVFGSVARGEADEASDLDLLVDVEPGVGMFGLAGFALDVEDLLGVLTQVSTPAGLKQRIRPRALSEAVPVGEATSTGTATHLVVGSA